MKNIIFILIITVITITSCNQQQHKSKENGIQLTNEFLVHEWMLDSLYGSSEFIQDWVYFTPEGEFWRCSHYSESQLIDSLLTFKEDKVFKNGKIVYSITALDSSNITLKANSEQTYHLKRWNQFDKEDIERFIQTNPTKLLLNGNWELDSSEISPTRMPSYCNDLMAGTRFDFKAKGILEIYPNDSINKCNSYSYRIWKDKISITEYDMVMELKIEKISTDKMVLKSRYIPREIAWTEEVMKAKQEGYNLYFSKK